MACKCPRHPMELLHLQACLNYQARNSNVTSTPNYRIPQQNLFRIMINQTVDYYLNKPRHIHALHNAIRITCRASVATGITCKTSVALGITCRAGVAIGITCWPRTVSDSDQRVLQKQLLRHGIVLAAPSNTFFRASTWPGPCQVLLEAITMAITMAF